MAKNDRFPSNPFHPTRLRRGWRRAGRVFRDPWFTVFLGYLALLAIVAVTVVSGFGCSWRQRPPRPPEEARALQIAGAVLGVNFMPAEPPQLSVYYPAPSCADQWNGRPGARTAKGNCSCGFLAPYTPHINVVRSPGQKLSATCFCRAAKQAEEAARWGFPDTYCKTEECTSGERERRIEACDEALRAQGL